MKTKWLNYKLALALLGIVFVMSLADQAFAQVAAAGGGAQGFVTWITSAAGLGSMVALAVCLVAVLLMFGQHTWTGIAFMVVGGLLFANATTIGGFFAGGG